VLIMADVKYPDSTPVDEPVRTGTKPQEPGSDIRVEKEPKTAPKVVKKASGGSASSRADGCAERGKTRGRMA
jgi:hypothetical protein